MDDYRNSDSILQGAPADLPPLVPDQTRWIPVAAPIFVGNEREYVEECLQSGWISSNGRFIQRFEDAFAAFCGTRYALSCCNGTAALHLALLALGIGPDDEVIIPTLTYVATANAVAYCGARPVCVDSERESWNMDPNKIEEVITPRTRAILVVHLYGHPANMGPIMETAAKYGLLVIEDAAEAHGAEYMGRKVGGIGHIATFSFYGNKIITTGEGGMVTTNDATLAAKVRMLKGQGMDPNRRYWFPIVGYNYRMTNIEAAIGLAQLERIDWHLARRREIALRYRRGLQTRPWFNVQAELPWARNVYWMTTLLLGEDWPLSRADTMAALAHKGIETRPVFYPVHSLPMYRSAHGYRSFPVAEAIARSGMNLPSSASLTADDIDYVVRSLLDL
jgi:perosamine synthetase